MNDQTTKKERREAARAARIAAEQEAQAGAQRKRRLQILGGVIAAAAVVVVIAIVVSSGGSSGPKKHKAGDALQGRSEVTAMLQGIPQKGITLGRADAKVTMIEFADLQCPVCQQYSLQVLPRIVQDYVRTGKVKIDLRLVNILDRNGVTDSERMARVAYGAQLQDKLWNFADLVYWNQGEEETNYATDAYIRQIASAVPGLNVQAAFAQRSSGGATAQLGAAMTLFNRYGAQGTPTLVVGKTGGDMKTLQSFDEQSVRKALDAAGA